MVNYSMKAEPEDRSHLCAANGCSREGVYGVKIAFFMTKGGAPVFAKTNMKVCEVHKKVTVDDIFPTPDTWETVQAHFLSNNLKLPKKELTKITLFKL